MKCQNCGSSEANFHYSSNVNGSVTETHLCSQCAAESGIDIGQLFNQNLLDFGSMFEGMFPIRGEIGAFMPMAIPVARPGVVFPYTVQRRPGLHPGTISGGNQYQCGCGQSKAQEAGIEVDELMSKRRELNMQMRAAVENEEFEKAAELRDRIKELETQV